MIIDKLIDKILEKQNPSAVGLDTCLAYLPLDMQSSIKNGNDVCNSIFEFNKRIIDKIYDIVPAVKVQIAYYEQYGLYGLEAFKKTLDYAKSKDLIVISDVKRNDIGSTAECYSKAYLGGVNINGFDINDFESDFVTVNGYLGSDGINPFLDDCKNNDKGIFILVKTSNVSSFEIQDRQLRSGERIYEIMGYYVSKWGKEFIGKYGYSSIGAVVGATQPQQAIVLRTENPSSFFLIPGYGMQGGKASDIANSFDARGLGGIVNSSRKILCAYKSDKYSKLSFDDAAREAALEMKEDLTSALNAAGKTMLKKKLKGV